MLKLRFEAFFFHKIIIEKKKLKKNKNKIVVGNFY